MFGAKEPSARPAAQDRHPRKMDTRIPKRFTKAPITGPKNMNTAIVIELTQAVLSRLSSNSSMKTGKSTPKEKENPIVRTIHNVEQKQRNHDQMLSCLTDETSPQHEAIFREDLESIPRVWHLYSVLNIDLENTSFHEYKVFILFV